MMNNKHTLFLILIAFALFSCEEKPYISNPGDNNHDYISPGLDSVHVDDDSSLDVPEGTISVKEALAIGKQLQAGTYSGTIQTDSKGNLYTAEEYYIKGIVQNVDGYKLYDNKWEATFYLVDSPYAFDRFYCYQVYTNRANENEGVAKGNVVVIKGKIMCYGNTIETFNSATVYSTTWTAPVIETKGDGSHNNPYSVADVILLGGTNNVSGFVRGYIIGAVADESREMTTDNIQLANVTDKASNVILADNLNETDPRNIVPVQLPRGDVRDALKIGSKCPEHYGKQVLIYGQMGKWVSAPAVLSVSYAEIDGNSVGNRPNE